LISLRRAKVGNLELSGVDLQACRFEGAHGLDRMRLEFVQFAETPASWQWRRFPWRWTRRQALAEEHQWRHSERQQDGWYADDLRLAGEEIGPLAPERIAEIYRMLRKGREDSKDEPGAADFYYGEMEMRRQKPERAARAGSVAGSEGLVTRSAGWGERLTLSLYWLVSGYGLRASRALFALAVTIALGAVLLDLFGFEPQRGPANGTLLFSLESSVSLLRAPEAELTAGGEVIQIVLRLAGPLFFGLTLLSLRGRVKR
jgi:hypothetical protein